MAEEAVLYPQSEDDAWKALQDALDQKLELAPDIKVVWDGWPVIKIYLPNVPEGLKIAVSQLGFPYLGKHAS